jgi:threonyl-tRNA synthetase
MKNGGIRTELDDRNEKIGYKIREWETKKVPYMLVLGDKERQAGNAALRMHRKGDQGAVGVDEIIRRIQEQIVEKRITI